MIVAEDFDYYISFVIGFRILALRFFMFFHNVGLDYLTLLQNYVQNNFILSPWPSEVLNEIFSGNRMENDFQKWVLGLMEAMTKYGARLTHSHELPMTFQFLRPRSWMSIFIDRAARARVVRLIASTYPDGYYQQITSEILLRYAPLCSTSFWQYD